MSARPSRDLRPGQTEPVDSRSVEVDAATSDDTFLKWSATGLSRFARLARTPEGAVIIAILALAIVLRTWDLGSRALHHDESLHAYYSWVLSRTLEFQHNPLMHGPFQFIGMATVFRIFGDSDATARLLAAITGTIAVAVPLLLLRDQLGRTGSIIASLLLAVSPALVYFSRFAREDTYYLLWTFLLAACLWRYVENPKPRFLYGGVAALVMAFATKEAAYFLALVFGLFLLIYALPDARSLVRSRFRAWPPAASFLLVMTTLVLPLAAAGVGIFQDRIGVSLINPDPAPLRADHQVKYLPGPIGAPISQGPGLASGVFDRFRSLTGLELSSTQTLQNPEAGILRVAGISLQALDVATILVLGLFLIGLVIGLRWNWRLWLVSALIFWGLFVTLFTTVFTNWLGVASGVWQSLGYWVAQQDVARGGQPWYYYPMLLATYEFLPLIVGIASGIYLIWKRDGLGLFLTFWFLLSLIAFTYAAEKMPWLSVHLALPLILLAGRGLGLLLETTWRKRLVLTSNQRLVRWGGLGLAGVLLLLTAQASLRASFVHGDIPVEMLVYTQTAPAVARTAEEIERLSQTTGQGAGFPITIDTMDGFGWPWYWYVRDFNRVEYRCLGDPGSCGAGADPLSKRSTEGAVIVAHSGNEAATSPNVSNHQTGVKIPFRQWFPEELYRGGTDYARGLTPLEVARGALHPSTWGTIWRYWTTRELPQALGHVDVIVYFQNGLTPSQPLVQDSDAPKPGAS